MKLAKIYLLPINQTNPSTIQVTKWALPYLRKQAGGKDIARELANVDAQGAEVAANRDSLSSFENYLGYERTAGFSSSGGARYDRRQLYTVPESLGLNQRLFILYALMFRHNL